MGHARRAAHVSKIKEGANGMEKASVKYAHLHRGEGTGHWDQLRSIAIVRGFRQDASMLQNLTATKRLTSLSADVSCFPRPSAWKGGTDHAQKRLMAGIGIVNV
mmetsp:Transcript_30797/g.70460  ORF Transcript_30797/g.70460 Transcript_30797/m.70460 type:complete len:104 (+) Transcript_30797:526-837(+)